MMQQQILQKSDLDSETIEKKFNNIEMNNWEFRDNDTLEASFEQGIKIRKNKKLLIASVEDAEWIFGRGRFQIHSESNGHFNCQFFSLKSGFELIILHEQIIERIKSLSHLEYISKNTILEKSKKQVEKFMNIPDLKKEKKQIKFPSEWNFIRTLLLLHLIKNGKNMENIVYKVDILDNIQITSYEDYCRDNDSEINLYNGLDIGKGGWFFHYDDVKNILFLLHGKSSTKNHSIKLLKDMLRFCFNMKDEILEFPTKECNKWQIEKIFKGTLNNYEELYDIFNDILISKFSNHKRSPNPWSNNEEKKEWNDENTMHQKIDDSKRWKTRSEAENRFKTLQKRYTEELILNTPQVRINLEQLYSGRVCILEQRPIATEYSDVEMHQVPNNKISISRKMLGNNQEILEKILEKFDISEELGLGDTFLVCGNTNDKFQRTSNQDRLDLVKDFWNYEIFNHWDQNENFIRIDNAVKSPAGVYFTIHLHKLHALHIYSFYRAIAGI